MADKGQQQGRDLENSGEMSQHEGNSRLAKLDESSALSLLLVLVRSQDQVGHSQKV